MYTNLTYSHTCNFFSREMNTQYSHVDALSSSSSLENTAKVSVKTIVSLKFRTETVPSARSRHYFILQISITLARWYRQSQYFFRTKTTKLNQSRRIFVHVLLFSPLFHTFLHGIEPVDVIYSMITLPHRVR